MARVGTYLNFERETEAAFGFYREVFGGEFEGAGIMRMGLNVMPDTRDEGDRLFSALSDGGSVESPTADMFWGDYWGSCKDRFGVQWMINVMTAPAP